MASSELLQLSDASPLKQVSAPFRRWAGFVAMCVAMFMAILDIQVVASSLVVMGKALHVGTDYLSWIQTAYLTAEIVSIPLTGWLTRSFTLRNFFVGATLGFTFASLGCALSDNYTVLITFRVIQGFFGGTLIPAVFSAVFLELPKEDEAKATAAAGVAAMLAPSLGPLIGGYLSERYSWHWIFLINILPGLVSAGVVWISLRKGKANAKEFWLIDWPSILFTSVSLSCLELLLKQGPVLHWRGLQVDLYATGMLVSGTIAVRRCLTRAKPFVDLRQFGQLHFSIGCALNFLLGAGLYGSTYLLALFLGLVRGHLPLEIGEVVAIAGATQVLMAAPTAWAETRFDGRLVVLVGFGCLVAAFFLNSFSTAQSDFDDFVLPQVLRGMAFLTCLLPATRLALGAQSQGAVADASGLFNLLRNVGGAIGIAGADTILRERTPDHVTAIVNRLMAGDPSAARLVGLPTARFHNVPIGPVDAFTRSIVAPLVQKAALVQAFNEAWFVLGLLCALSFLLIPAMRRSAVGAGDAVHPAAPRGSPVAPVEG